MSRVQTIEIRDDEAEQRLDRWFRRQFPHVSQGRVEKMCRKGEIRVDGGRVKSNTRVGPGQTVRIPPLPSEDEVAQQREQPFVSKADAKMIQDCVIHMDDDVIVINKPAGLAVQGGSKTTRHVDGMTPALQYDKREAPRLVHRLDKDTSGVLVLARTQAAASHLTKAFRHHGTRKIYWALVAGVPYPKIGTIKFGLVKAPGHGAKGEGEKMHCVHPKDVDATYGAKRAHTDYATLCFLGQRASWLAMVPVTGRTHQLRAHIAEMGHPIVGDGKYGGSGQENMGDGWGAELGEEVSKKMHLHARSLTIQHPNGSELHVEAKLPPHMQSTWNYFGWTERDVPNDPFDADEQWQS